MSEKRRREPADQAFHATPSWYEKSAYDIYAAEISRK